jgi:hypothetical protein
MPLALEWSHRAGARQLRHVNYLSKHSLKSNWVKLAADWSNSQPPEARQKATRRLVEPGGRLPA